MKKKGKKEEDDEDINEIMKGKVKIGIKGGVKDNK